MKYLLLVRLCLFIAGAQFFFSCKSLQSSQASQFKAKYHSEQYSSELAKEDASEESYPTSQAASSTNIPSIDELQADATNDEAYKQIASQAKNRKEEIKQHLAKLSPQMKESLRKAQEIVKNNETDRLAGKKITKAAKKKEKAALRSVLREANKKASDQEILEIVLAILIPPLAVFIHDNDATTRFWITLILWLAGFILLWPLYILGVLSVIAAIVYALLIVTDSI